MAAALLPAPPSNLEAEEAVVGAILFSGRVIEQVRHLLGPGDFHSSGLRAIYEAQLEIAQRDHPIDIITVGQEMQRLGTLALILHHGREAYLAELTSKVATVENVTHHAAIVRQESLRRQEIVLRSRALERVQAGCDPAQIDLRLAEVRRQALCIGQAPDQSLAITPMSDVQAELVYWLWHGRVPLGMLSLIEGEPDMGKSTLLLDVAARVTTGRALPGEEEEREPSNVLLWAPEDPAPQVIRPRLDAAGADLSRIDLLTDPLTLPDDAVRLETTIRRSGARLVIIEPLTAALAGRVDSYKDHDVRRALMPLVETAVRTGCAIVAIRHLRKGEGAAIHRGGGSIAISALARSVLAVGKDPADDAVRVIARTKGNLAALPPALRFRFVPSGHVARVEWMGECSISADDLLAVKKDKPRDRGALQDAMDVLRQLLADGPMLSSDVEEQAQAAGVRLRTLRRAREEIGVRMRKDPNLFGQWRWSLPLP